MSDTIEITISAQRCIHEWRDFTVEVPAKASDDAVVESILDQIDDDNSWYPGEIHRSFQIDEGHLNGRSICYADEPIDRAASDLLDALEYALPLIEESPGACEIYRAAAEKKARAAIDKAKRHVTSNTDQPSLI